MAVIDLTTGRYADEAPQQGAEAPEQLPSESIQGGPALDFLNNLAAGANRSVIDLVDFLGTDTVNAVLDLAGVEQRLPKLSQKAAEVGIGVPSGEEGLLKELTYAGGTAIPAAASLIPQAGRNLATSAGQAAELLGFGAAKPSGLQVVEASDKVARELALKRQSGDVVAAGFKLDDAGKVVPDKIQELALKAGVDEGAVSMVAAANRPTKDRINKMIDVVEGGLKNLKFRSQNRPASVVGEAINDRLKIVQDANRQAGQSIDVVANKLRGKPVNIDSAMAGFLDDLAKEDIVFKNGKLDFSDSSFEGFNAAQNVINRVVKRLYDTKDPTNNAYKVHTAKRFLDEQISSGKAETGLSGRAESIIKRLRKGLDDSLDSEHPEYDAVNTTYKETRDALDELQSIAGTKVDLSAENASKALGVMSRKLLSNYQSGTRVENLFSDLDALARTYGSPLNTSIADDLTELVAMESEIRRLFPEIVAPNTLEGTQMRATASGVADLATGGNSSLVRLAAKAADKALTKSESKKVQERLKALRELVNNGSN